VLFLYHSRQEGDVSREREEERRKEYIYHTKKRMDGRRPQHSVRIKIAMKARVDEKFSNDFFLKKSDLLKTQESERERRIQNL